MTEIFNQSVSSAECRSAEYIHRDSPPLVVPEVPEPLFDQELIYNGQAWVNKDVDESLSLFMVKKILQSDNDEDKHELLKSITRNIAIEMREILLSSYFENFDELILDNIQLIHNYLYNISK
jgi:hypothetical protein